MSNDFMSRGGRLMIKCSILVLACFLTYIPVAYGETYRWVDENGGMHFSDQPPPAPLQTPVDPPPATPIKPRIVTSSAESPVPQIRALLRENKFAALNALLEKRQVAAAKDVLLEDDLFGAYEAFAINDRTYEELLNRWVAGYPQTYQPYLARATYYFHMGWETRGNKWAAETEDKQFQGMKEYFNRSGLDLQQVFQKNIKSAVPYRLLLGMLTKSDGAEVRRKVLEKGLEVAPASFYLRATYLIGNTPRWGGSYEEMQTIADEAKKYLAKNPRLATLQGFVYYDAGDLKASAKNYGDAEILLTKALSFGDYGLYFNKRASIRSTLGKYDEALQDINRAIELWPHSGDYYSLRSKILVSLNRMDEARRDIELADLLLPGNENIVSQRRRLAAAFENQGYTLQKMKNPQAAVGSYSSAIRTDPNNATSYVRRARALIEQNKHDEALADLRQAIELDPKEFDTYLLLDWVLARQKAWPQIIESWDKYIALNPDHGRAYVERGGAYYRQGDLTAALKDAKKAADLGDEDGRQLYERFRVGEKK